MPEPAGAPGKRQPWGAQSIHPLDRPGTGLGNTSTEPSHPLQRCPCVLSQACQHAWRAEQVRGCITGRLRPKLVAYSSLLLPLCFQQHIFSSSASAPQYLLSFYCPCSQYPPICSLFIVSPQLLTTLCIKGTCRSCANQVLRKLSNTAVKRSSFPPTHIVRNTATPSSSLTEILVHGYPLTQTLPPNTQLEIRLASDHIEARHLWIAPLGC